MRPWLLVLICVSLSSSCRKTEINPPQAEQGYYPHFDRFIGTFHVLKSIHYSPPDIDYDSSYQQTIEVIYPDSNWVAFNFSYWDLKVFIPGTYTPTLVTETFSLLKRSDNYYTFDSAHHQVAHISIEGDSLLMDKNWELPPNEYLWVRFNGKK